MPFTPITGRNLRYFQAFLPKDFLLSTEGHYAIGHIGENGSANGAIAYAVDPARDLVEIVSLFVAPQCRRERIGTGLLDQMMGHIVEFPDIRQCFITVENTAEESAGLCRFFEFQRFGKTPSATREFSIRLEEIAQCEYFAKSPVQSRAVLPLSHVPSMDRRAYYQQNAAAAPFRGNLSRKELDESVSCAYWKDGQIQALLLVSRQEDYLLLETVHSRLNSPQMLLSLCRIAFSQACERYSPDTKVVVFATTQNTQRLICELFEGRQRENGDFSTYTFWFF